MSENKRKTTPRRRPAADKRTGLIFGLHSALSRIERAPQSIISAQIDGTNQNSRLQEVLQCLVENGINPEPVSRKKLDSFTGGGNHQGVALSVRPDELPHEKELPERLDQLARPPLILVLDQVTDPHNLGACLRTADGAGVDLVIVPKDGSCPITETVHRVASGAAETIPVFYVTNLARTLRMLKERGIWLIGLADESATALSAMKYPQACAFVMGAEGSGLRRLTREQCDELVAIPMRGSVSSLNVSVATGVVLYAYRRAFP